MSKASACLWEGMRDSLGDFPGGGLSMSILTTLGGGVGDGPPVKASGRMGFRTYTDGPRGVGQWPSMH